MTVIFAPGCFQGGDEDLTSEGKGKPTVTIDFPSSVEPGSTQTASLEVTNPGPGDMPSVVVAFAFVGPVATEGELPPAIVTVGTKGENPSIKGVDPPPGGVSPDGVVYVFEGLEAGAAMRITFEIVVPEEPGSAANSVTVYDGADPSRAAGARLQTTVT